ncbi:MAG TPA: thioredoxin [Ktedonobacteraceae bacterium]|nr:thioredoxin [Ktedonobacteraceae bacterium]
MASTRNISVLGKDADFEGEVLNAPIPVLVAFGATWCGPCKALAPILEKIASDFQGKVKVVSVDIDDCTEVTKKYGVKSVPTVLTFNQGQKTGQAVGLTNYENLLKLLGF